MRAVLLAAILVIATGCGKAVMLEAPYPWPKYGPLYDSQQGVVAYSLNGSHAHIESGKRSAYRLMQHACRGPYRIVSTYNNRQAPGSTIQNAEAPTITTRHLRFECRPHAQRNSLNPYLRAW